MKKFVRWLLIKPILWVATSFSSKPSRERIYQALSKLYEKIIRQPSEKGLVISFELSAGKFIIFSDQHKGARNGADDFKQAEPNYLAALEYYNKENFNFVSLGDSEELWENTLMQIKKYNTATFVVERKFISRSAFIKIYGNHDLFWENDPFASLHLKNIYKEDLKIYEAVLLTTTINNKSFQIFCTHGHQGDGQSDGNWFSKFFVSNIWGPVQAYLGINPNTPAYDKEEKTLHNKIMYDWSATQKNMILITGHTHQPVFESLTHIEKLFKQLQLARLADDIKKIDELDKEIRKREREFSAISTDYLTMKPSYFNSGCCCFSDGDITGLEISGGYIRLVKWKLENEHSKRVVLEEVSLAYLAKEL